jgi:hypothetical protein
MHLDGLLRRAEVPGDLLVQAPAHHVLEHELAIGIQAARNETTITAGTNPSFLARRALVSRPIIA